jgi:hypothetical protein
VSKRMQHEMKPEERPLSERYRLLGEQWADADGAANLLEELKTATLEQRKTKVIMADMEAQRAAAIPGEITAVREIPDNKAERIVKASPEWESYIRQMCNARAAANKLRVQMEGLKLEHSEWTARDANARHEARLTRG